MITTAIRAKRILDAIPGYQSAQSSEFSSSFKRVENFGEMIGFYKNPDGEPEDIVLIFSAGVLWRRKGEDHSVLFSDIEKVALTNEKESEDLEIKARKETFLLHIRGRRDRFFDSLEFYRFFKRVLEDLRSNR
jgi:hypothetical protein